MKKGNCEVTTIEYCIEMYEKKNQCVLLSNGKVIGFVREDEV